MQTNADVMATLVEHYGQDKFTELYETAQKNHKTPRAALNSLDTVERNITVKGLWVNTGYSRSRKTQEVTRITFTLLGKDGSPLYVNTPGKRYGRDAVIGRIKTDWPNIPQRLTPISMAKIRSRFSISTGNTNYYVTEKSTMALMDDFHSDIPVLFSFEEGIRQTEEELESGLGDFETSKYLFFAEVQGVNVYENTDGEVDVITATLRDIDSRTVNTKIQDNLADLFGDDAEDMKEDVEELQLSLRRMPVLVQGRFFLRNAGDVITIDDGEIELERDVTSLIVKNTGFIVSVEDIPESTRETLQTQLEAIEQT